MKKSFLISAGIIGLSVATAALIGLGSSVRAATRDCTTNAIAKCGVHTVAEMQQKYATNTAGDLDEIYAHYGISSQDVKAGMVKQGRTYKDGRVVVDGKTVATNAASLGRVKKSGDYAVNISGKTYWEARNQDVFNADSLEVFVFTKADGTYKSAVIKDCGNPVKAKPVEKPEPPKPTPVYTCDSLKSHQINRTTYRFTVAATAKNGAAISQYAYDFGDGETMKTTKAVVEHQYAKAGSYAATVKVDVKVDGKLKTVTGNACAVKVAVAPEPKKPAEEKPEMCPIPGKETLPKDSTECVEGKGEETPEVLPATGAGSVLSGMMGITSLTAASYYYLRSRRALR